MRVNPSEPSALFVLNSLAIGGSETKIIRIANALAQSGTSVGIAYLNPRHAALGRIESGVSVTNLERRGKYSLRSYLRLRELVDQRAYSTIFAVSLYPLLYVVPVLRRFPSGTVKGVALVNTVDLVGRRALFGPLYAPLLRRCDELVFGCAAQKRHWVKKYRLPMERSRVIYNGVDDKHFSPTAATEQGAMLRRTLRIPDSAFIIGSVGRLAPEKNYDLLIESVARLNAMGRESYGILVGEGKQGEQLERLAVARGVTDKVKFVGLLADVRPALSLMDIFVLPANWETFSNAVLEAMAMERAVVLSEIGGAAEMVQHKKSGLLFPVGDIETLMSVLLELHDSLELRQTLGRRARERVVESFQFQGMVEQYRELS